MLCAKLLSSMTNKKNRKEEETCLVNAHKLFCLSRVCQVISMRHQISFLFLLDHLNPCQNGGICVQLQQDYFCICPKEYRGKNCEGKPWKAQCAFKYNTESPYLSLNGTSVFTKSFLTFLTCIHILSVDQLTLMRSFTR